MFWRITHDALKWLGISFFPFTAFIFLGGMALAASFPETKPWLAQRYEDALAVTAHPAFWVVALLVFIVWLVAFIWSGHKVGKEETGDTHHHHYYAPLTDLQPQQQNVRARGQHSVIQVDNASHGHISEQVQSLRLDGLYVGWMIASAGRLDSDQYLEIALRGYNGSGHSLRRAALSGHIMWNDAPLPTPASMNSNLDEIIPDATEFVVIFHQHVTLDAARQMLVAFEASSGTILGLNSLNVMVQSVGDANLTARLPLWDGLHLRRLDDLFTGRVIAASANVAIKSAVSMSMTVTRADGSTEERNA